MLNCPQTPSFLRAPAERLVETLLGAQNPATPEFAASMVQLVADAHAQNDTGEPGAFHHAFTELLTERLLASSQAHERRAALESLLAASRELPESRLASLQVQAEQSGYDSAEDFVRSSLRRPIEASIGRLAMRPFDELDQFTRSLLAQTDPLSAAAEGADEVKRRVRAIIDANAVHDRSYGETRLSGDNWQHCAWAPELRVDVAGHSIGCSWWGYRDAARVLAMAELAEKLQSIREKLPSAAAFAAEVERFGVKGSTLGLLQQVLPALDEALFADYGFGAYVPDFRLVSTDEFEHWRGGLPAGDELRAAYDWAAGRALKLRSSAVKSEDREGATGAGRYDSVDCPAGASFETFAALAAQVFASVDNERAAAYRQEKQISDERMGLIVQLLEPVVPERKGYLNSIRAGRPELIEFVHGESGTRPVAYREKVRDELIFPHDQVLSDMLVFQHDGLGFMDRTARRILLTGYVLELVLGAPQQIEYVDTGADRLAVLQARRLPPSYSERVAAAFPAGEPLFEGVGLRAIDEVLDVLPASLENKERRGVVVFSRSFAGSKNFEPEQFFPKSGAVVVLQPSRDSSGHVETLAIERGLSCIFAPGKGEISGMGAYLAGKLEERGGKSVPIEESLGGHTRVHVVCDGLRGCLYPAQG